MSTGESLELTTAPAEPPAPPGRRPGVVTADLVLTVLLMALFGWAFVQAGQWSFQAALFPRMVTGAGIVFGALHLVQMGMARRRGHVEPGAGRTAAADGPDDVAHLFRTAGARRWGAALGWAAGFFALLWVAGLYVTASVFSLLYLRVAGRWSWRFCVLYAAAVGLVLYGAFAMALQVPTPPGLF